MSEYISSTNEYNRVWYGKGPRAAAAAEGARPPVGGHLAIMIGVGVPREIDNLRRWRAIASTDVTGAPAARGVPHVCLAAVRAIHDDWL
eukprot:1257186-Lingulodinium_polyedra.AAC.1